MVSFATSDNINRAVIATYLIANGILKTREEGFRTILSEWGDYVPAPKTSTS